MIIHYKGKELTIRILTEAVYMTGGWTLRSYMNGQGKGAWERVLGDFSSYTLGHFFDWPFFSIEYCGTKTATPAKNNGATARPKITIVLE